VREWERRRVREWERGRMGEEEKLVRDQKGGNKPVFGINSHPQNFAINCQLSTFNLSVGWLSSII
jgi:hypothetical protein